MPKNKKINRIRNTYVIISLKDSADMPQQSTFHFLQSAVLACFFLLSLENIAGADCTNCNKIYEQLEKNKDLIIRATDLLAKNNAMLAITPAGNTSARVKLGSNLFVLKAKIETVNNQSAVMQESIKKDCTACPPPPPPKEKDKK